MQDNDHRTAPVIDVPRELGGAKELPLLPPDPEPAAAGEESEAVGLLRRFHHGDSAATAALAAPGEEVVPALLFGRHEAADAPGADPLYLFPPNASDPDRFCLPLADLLADRARALDHPPDDARVLEGALVRLVRHVREALTGHQAPVDAAGILDPAAVATERELSHDPSGASRLAGEVERIIAELPAGAKLLSLGDNAALHLFILAAERRGRRRRDEFREEITRLRRGLREMLRAERAKLGAGSKPDVLRETVGSAGAAHMDAEALAEILGPSRGVEALAPERRRRIETVVEVLERHLAEDPRPVLTVIGPGEIPIGVDPASVSWHPVPRSGATGAALERFDLAALAHVELFGAMRAARLLATGAYDPARYDALLDAFSPESFSIRELREIPPVLAIESAEHLAGPGMRDLSRFLRSARPIQVIVSVHPETDPAAPREEDPAGGHRCELAYLGISHREALVHQSSAAHPDHLMRGFIAGLDASRPSLHVVASDLTVSGTAPPRGVSVHARAALEGRAHPFIHYNPEAGETWARRVDFAGNPQPESAWPEHDLACRREDGTTGTITLAFTFADFVLLDRRFVEHFRVIPAGCGHDDLLALGAYLTLPAEEADHRLPFIRAVDGNDGTLHRLAVSRRLAQSCRDRLDFWRTLQELAGVRNEHVREAVERERDRLHAEFGAEQERLAADRAASVEQARAQAAGEAMRGLAQALLQGDPSVLAAGLTVAPPPVPAAAAPAPTAPPAGAEPETPAAVEAEEEEEASEEPWINSVLCTSCNDCLAINAQMFVYNGDKQAVIGDAKAGTYAEMVKAAEKCPARCIHPGLPLDPNEPGVEALIERAKPFN